MRSLVPSGGVDLDEDDGEKEEDWDDCRHLSNVEKGEKGRQLLHTNTWMMNADQT